MKRRISLHKTYFVALATVLLGMAVFSDADALFRRMPIFQAIDVVELQDASKLHPTDAAYGLFSAAFPEETMYSYQDYSLHCNPTGETEASSVWYDFRSRGAADDPLVELDLELNTIYTCRGMIRTNEAGGIRLYTHHGEEFQTMICHEDELESGVSIFDENKTRCQTGATSAADDNLPRVAFRSGYVGQHSVNGRWITDPNGEEMSTYEFNSNSEKLRYCQKFWPDTNRVLDEYITDQTITNWYKEGNLRRPSTMNVRTYECEVATYHWSQEEYGECLCDGNKYRETHCTDHRGGIFEDSYCDPTTKPDLMAPCTEPRSCFDWDEDRYGDCQCDGNKYMEHKCRNFGLEELDGVRPVPDVPRIWSSYREFVEDSICEGWGIVEPTTSTACGLYDLPSECFTWNHSGYQDCECTGLKERNYDCYNETTGLYASDTYCTDPEPTGQDSCTIPSSCYSWVAMGYNTCDCTGTQSMHYKCVNMGQTVQDYYCSHIPKPVDIRDCAAPNTCYDWEFSGSYKTCECVPQQKEKIYHCENDVTGDVVEDSVCSFRGDKPVLYSPCLESELPAECFCDADDWNVPQPCYDGCYTQSYINFGSKKTGVECVGDEGRPQNNCYDDQECCTDYDCPSTKVCGPLNTCIPKYHRYICNNGNWGLINFNYSTSTLNCTGNVYSGLPAYCLSTPTGNCCTTNYGTSCVSGHYTGQTYNCDGVCSGGSACTKPDNSTWYSDDGCTWNCDTGYRVSGSTCIPRYHQYTCSDGRWILNAYNVSTTTSGCTETTNSGVSVYCSSTPTGTCLPLCKTGDWTTPTCDSCYTRPYTAYGTPTKACTGIGGRTSILCSATKECCENSDCNFYQRCEFNRCKTIFGF